MQEATASCGAVSVMQRPPVVVGSPSCGVIKHSGKVGGLVHHAQPLLRRSQCIRVRPDICPDICNLLERFPQPCHLHVAAAESLKDKDNARRRSSNRGRRVRHCKPVDHNSQEKLHQR